MGGRRSLRLRLNSAEAEALLGLAELGNKTIDILDTGSSAGIDPME